MDLAGFLWLSSCKNCQRHDEIIYFSKKMTSGGNWCEYFKVISVSASVVIEKSYIPWFIKHRFYWVKLDALDHLTRFRKKLRNKFYI